jgi:hypothetical protein
LPGNERPFFIEAAEGSASGRVATTGIVAVDATVRLGCTTDESTANRAGCAADQRAIRAANGTTDGCAAKTTDGCALLGLRAGSERQDEKNGCDRLFHVLTFLERCSGADDPLNQPLHPPSCRLKKAT